MNRDLIDRTNKDIDNTIYYLEKVIVSLKSLREGLPMASFMHMEKIKQVNKLIEGFK